MVEEKVISKKYLREVNKSLEMIPLTFDVMFKGVFERNMLIIDTTIIPINATNKYIPQFDKSFFVFNPQIARTANIIDVNKNTSNIDDNS